MLAMPLGEFSRDRLPLSKVPVDKPVDQFRDAPLDLSRGIGDDLVFEFLLNARAVQQVGEAPESKRLFEKTVAASFHVGKNLLDRGDAQLEPAFHVVAVYGRSADVTNSTRSDRGTKSVVRRSCSRMIALVPGVSTMWTSRSSSTGAVRMRRPLASVSDCTTLPYFSSWICAVVGVTPSSTTDRPSKPLMN